MRMTPPIIKTELARVANVRRAMPYIGGFVALWGVAAVLKIYRAVQIAVAFGLSRRQAIELITMSNSCRITKSFPGFAMVFYDLAISSCIAGTAFCLGVGILVLSAIAQRRQTAILQYVQELEQSVEARDGGSGTERKD